VLLRCVLRSLLSLEALSFVSLQMREYVMRSEMGCNRFATVSCLVHRLVGTLRGCHCIFLTLRKRSRLRTASQIPEHWYSHSHMSRSSRGCGSSLDFNLRTVMVLYPRADVDNCRLSLNPSWCINSVEISGSDSRGMKFFVYIFCICRTFMRGSQPLPRMRGPFTSCHF
jgi:hypothetical protein